MNTLIIDVREPDEYAQRHFPGAINIPPEDLLAGAPQLKDVPKDTRLVLYCRSGARSNTSMHFLRQIGFDNLVNGINQDHVAKNYSAGSA